MSGDSSHSPDKIFCSFCGKRRVEVQRLFAGGGGGLSGVIFICDECVIFSARVMAEGDEEWRDKFIAELSKPLSST